MRVVRVLQGRLKSREAHTYRTRPTPNADPKKLSLNRLLFGRKDYAKSLQEKLDSYKTTKPIRKNAVLAVEYLLTASPEFFSAGAGTEQHRRLNDWCQVQIEFLKEKHGAENILCAYLHLDEKTPHIEAFVLPLDKNNKLNCRDFLGGPQKMVELQNEYAKANEKFGLTRGLKGSSADHQKVRNFYDAINQAPEVTNSALKKAVIIDKPSVSDMLKPERFLDEQQRKIFSNVVELFRGTVYMSKLAPQAKKILKETERAGRAMGKQKKKYEKEVEQYKKQLLDQMKVLQTLEDLTDENTQLKKELETAREVIRRLSPANAPHSRLTA